MNPKSILIIEDEHALGSALSLLVRRMGHLPTLAASGKAGLEELDKAGFDAAVIDIGLPDMSGLEVLEKIRNEGADLPVLVVTAHATLQHAIDSQKSGATAYLNKPLDMEQFKRQLAALLEPAIGVSNAAGPARPEPGSPTLIGAAPCMRGAFVGIARACEGAFPVLISGPGGSGKSLAARVIHAHSRQSSGPFHEIPCDGLERWEVLPEWSGGSVVLDDLAALNANAQAELARWLNREVGQSPRILATIADEPALAVKAGSLREDLYFALRPALVPIPPLRERSSDIPALCAFFAGLKGEGGEVPEITPPVMAALQAHDWPGNVRELKHVLDVALSMSRGGPLFLGHLPKSVAPVEAEPVNGGQLGGELEATIHRWLEQQLAGRDEVSYDELLQRMETEMLKYLLRRFDQKPTRLAAAMKLHRGTLRQKLQRCGLQRSGD